MEFDVSSGWRIQREQVEHYKQRMTPEQAEVFVASVEAMNAAITWTLKTGYDVPRGVDVERLAWLARGESTEAYREWRRLMD